MTASEALRETPRVRWYALWTWRSPVKKKTNEAAIAGT